MNIQQPDAFIQEPMISEDRVTREWTAESWAEFIDNFPGDPNFPPFESYRPGPEALPPSPFADLEQ